MDEWANQQVVELAELCSVLGGSVVESDCYASYLSELGRVAELDDASPSLRDHVRRLQIIKRPSIRMLINSAALQGVSVKDILLRPKEAAARPLLDQWAERAILPLDMGRHDDVTREVSRLCEHLMKLSKHVLIPPLRFILKDFGLHRSRLREFRIDVYERSTELFESQLSIDDREFFKELFPLALHALRNMYQDRSSVMRWRLYCMLARDLGITREEVAPACNSALAYHKLSRPAKERLGAIGVNPEARAYKAKKPQRPAEQIPLF